MTYQQEHIKPYSNTEEKASQVEQMFDNIAPSYDRLNHRLSWNTQKILDIATGTGDFAILAAKMLRPKQLIGTDISEGMMEIGKQKVIQEGLQEIVSFKREDCMRLSFDNQSFDAVTAAFGIRNFADLDQGLKEMCRVLRPGGHLSIVELTTPVHFPMNGKAPVWEHPSHVRYLRPGNWTVSVWVSSQSQSSPSQK